jgi:hypothetical protein
MTMQVLFCVPHLFRTCALDGSWEILTYTPSVFGSQLTFLSRIHYFQRECCLNNTSPLLPSRFSPNIPRLDTTCQA